MMSLGRLLAMVLVVLVMHMPVSNASFLHNRKEQAPKSNHSIARGGYTSSTRRLTPRMAISSSQLSRNGRRNGKSSKTRVNYANEDTQALIVLPRTLKSPGGLLLPSLQQQQQEKKRMRSTTNSAMKLLDLAICGTYLCSSFVMNLPILLVPMAAAEFSTSSTTSVASIVVKITSIAIMGGGLGKLVNGFVCEQVGAKRSSGLYLVACAICCLVFSMASQSTLGYAYGGIEYCVSMQWTALSVVFAQFYSKDQASFASGIMRMSLSSTCGQLLAKFAGTFLLQSMSWRTVALVGAVVAMIGACIVTALVPDSQTTTTQSSSMILRKQQHYHNKQPIEWSLVLEKIQDSARTVLTNPLFWAIGYAHAMSMVARCSDRILGEFFSQATNLPSTYYRFVKCVFVFVLLWSHFQILAPPPSFSLYRIDMWWTDIVSYDWLGAWSRIGTSLFFAQECRAPKTIRHETVYRSRSFGPGTRDSRAPICCSSHFLQVRHGWYSNVPFGMHDIVHGVSIFPNSNIGGFNQFQRRKGRVYFMV